MVYFAVSTPCHAIHQRTQQLNSDKILVSPPKPSNSSLVVTHFRSLRANSLTIRTNLFRLVGQNFPNLSVLSLRLRQQIPPNTNHESCSGWQTPLSKTASERARKELAQQNCGHEAGK